MRPLAKIAALALVALAAGCGAKAGPAGGPGDGPGASADAMGGGGSGGAPGRGPVPDGAGAGALDLRPAPVLDGGRDGAPSPGVPALDGGAVDRRPRIPQPPSGKPPCAPDAMAVHDGRCPYPVLVACVPNPAMRPTYVCYCFAPPSSGKWVCQDEPGGGGGVTIAAPTGAR